MPQLERSEEPDVRGKSGWPAAALSVLFALAGVPIYIWLMGVSSVRSSGWPAFLFLFLGSAFAVWQVRRFHTWAWRIAAGVNSTFLTLWTGAFFVFAALPKPSAAAHQLVSAPDFRLPDQYGQSVSLEASRKLGPVLLVFYRGHW